MLAARGADDGRAADLPFKLSSLEVEPQTPVRSGERITVRVRGEVPPHRSPSHHWGVRVRALHNAQPVFAVVITQREPRLGQPGSFEAVVTLQANTGAGYFVVETPMWDATGDYREVGQGPRAPFRVEGASFRGTTNLHAAIDVVEQVITPAIATG